MFFFFINFFLDFWIKIFEKNQFLNHLLHNASYFESRISNASDFEPFFHNSTNFESKNLERVIFWKKNLCNASDFEVKLICKKNRFWWKFCFQTITIGSFHPKNAKFAAMRFLNNQQLFKKMEKNRYPIITLEKKLILKQVFNKASDSNQDFQKKSVF